MRQPQTIFGEITVDRLGYCHDGEASVSLVDEQVPVLDRSFSYELQRQVVKATVQGLFDEAAERVGESTRVRMPKRSAEEVVQEAACDFDEFYQKRIPPPAQTVQPWSGR